MRWTFWWTRRRGMAVAEPAGRMRLERLQAALAEAGLAALYVRDTANIQWLTGFTGVFDEEQAHALFVPASGSHAWLHTDSRYITAMARAAEGAPFAVDADVKAFSAWAAERAADCGVAADELGLESSITLAEYRALEEAFGVQGRFQETKGLVLGLRAVKDAEEAARLKAAQAVTDAAFAHITGFMHAGMTERDVQLELDWFMLKNGADELAFPSIVACGENGASPHAVVSDKTLEPGQCVVMDFGARRDGYCSDMTRTVFLGEPEGRMWDAWATLRRANEAVEAMLRPGATGKEAHELALSVLEEGGFGGLMGHGLGHGVGIQIHEEPVLSPRSDRPLMPGNVVTVEPGIYIPGAFGMRLEDFGIITEDGFHVFTASTHELVVI